MPNRSAATEKRSNQGWSLLMGWVGRITAILGLCATLAGGAGWLLNHYRQQREREAQLSMAGTQTAQSDYQAAVDTYAAILKEDPRDRETLDDQLDTTLLWIENFSVLVPEGQSAGESAGRTLDAMMAILESGMTRSRGSRAADVQAHLGWAHWLNQHIAEREFGTAAEQDLRAALAADPANVYANAMLGNWMLQNGGNFTDAVQHLNSAVASGKVRAWTRRMQVGGLSSYSGPGARAELVRVANAMRIGGEPLSPEEKHRVLDFCCDIAVADPSDLAESLSAVTPPDAYRTYVWLENANTEDSADFMQRLDEDFVQAKLLEISGQAPQALLHYRVLQKKLRAYPNAVLNETVDASIMGISHPRSAGKPR